MACDALESALCEQLSSRRDDLLRQLSEYVSIPTGSGHRPGIDAFRDLLKQELERLGATIELIPGDPRPEWLRLPDQPSPDSAGGSGGAPTLVACRHVDPDLPRMLIACHLDTVHDPHGPFQKLEPLPDGRLATGPGAADMKGGIVVALAALEALHALEVPINWTVLLNCDEETGSFHSAAALAEVASRHDCGFAMEPALADGALAVERMGSGQFRIEVFGRSAHVGREFAKGVSAVNRLAEIILQIGSLADPDAGRIVSIGPLKGGAVVNAVPEYASAWGNARFADEDAGRALADAIDALATAGDAMPRVEVYRSWSRPAKPLTDVVRAFADRARAAAEDLGQSLPFASTGGVCDGNNLQAAGLPTLDTFGVRGGNLHRTDEFVELNSVVERSQLLAVLLKRMSVSCRVG